MIYLDNNATTMLAPKVLEAMTSYFFDQYGNPSSIYQLGKDARKTLEEARDEVAQALGAKSGREIIFTSGGTESNNTAIRSALKTYPVKRSIVISGVEHSSVNNLCKVLEKDGYRVVRIGVLRSGALDFNALRQALTSDVAIVSVMWANNETGVIFPIEQIAKEVKAKGVLFHVDAVQAVGKISINLSSMPVDFFSLSAHKFHGPKGMGALYVREGTPFQPLLYGGRQEKDRRAGTENVPGIVGLTKALSLAIQNLNVEAPRILATRNRFEKELLKMMPGSFINGMEEDRLPNTTNITIPGIEAETALIRLSDFQIAASSGSACQTGALEASHVLRAMGHTRESALSSLRFSLSRFTTDDEINGALEIIQKVIHTIQQLAELNKS